MTGEYSTRRFACRNVLWLLTLSVFCGKPDSPVDHSQHSVPVAKNSAPEQTIVHLSNGRAQEIGITTEPITVRDLVKTIRTSGVVKVNETKQAHIHLKFSGFVERVFADFTGKEVQAGSPLFSIYSPDLYSTENEFVLTLKRIESAPLASEEEKIQLGYIERRLELWDIPRAEMERLRKTRIAERSVIIRSPIAGVILEKNVLPGMTVEPSMDLYVVADLSTVWVQAQVYESEVPLVAIGQKARLTLDSMPGKPYEGRVTFIEPVVSEKTRTTAVRYEFANPGLKLRPGMFTTVELLTAQGRGPAVPVDAVIDTGSRKLVFVMEKPGEYRAREIQTGIQADAYYSVVSGLAAGDRVVTSGQFLLDSESRMKSAGTPGGHQGH
jgi:Cu(I)/Ag(I) efflux system membrane fusion protein